MSYDTQLVKTYMTVRKKRDEILSNSDDLFGGGTIPADTFGPIASLCRNLAASKRFVTGLKQELTIGIVFAMWHENTRIAKSSQENPNGEDCINDKLRALDWLFKDSVVNWHLYAVDDHCPYGSAEAARQAVAGSELERKITILELKQSFPFSEEPLSRMRDISESTKGGAIIHGLQRAMADGCEFVCYTDCDNSVHIAQVGLLLKEAIERDVPAVNGSSSVSGDDSLWHPSRRDYSPSARILGHLRRMMIGFEPPTHLMADPFKLFRSSYLKENLKRLQSFDFSFDMGIILGLVADQQPLYLAPFSMFDSYEESAWHLRGDALVEYQKIRGLAKTLIALNLPYNSELIEFATNFLTSPNEIETIFVSDPAPQMLNKSRSLGDPELMSPHDLVQFLTSVLTGMKHSAS